MMVEQLGLVARQQIRQQAQKAIETGHYDPWLASRDIPALLRIIDALEGQLVAACQQTDLAIAAAADTAWHWQCEYQRLAERLTLPPQPGAAERSFVEAALAFETYAEHIHDCPIALGRDWNCNCGLEELHITAETLRQARQAAPGAETGDE